MYQPMSDEYSTGLLQIIGTDAAPVTAVQLCEVADAIREVRDPNGPTGDAYILAQMRVYAHSRSMLARIAAADKEINRLRALLGANAENGDG